MNPGKSKLAFSLRCGVVVCMLTQLLYAQTTSTPPETKADDTSTVLHGVTVKDPYQWLEDGASPATRSWIAAQQAYTNQMLSNRPGVTSLRPEIHELVDLEETHRALYRAGRYFIEKKPAHHEQASIFVREGAAGADKLLLDPTLIASDGSATVELLNVSEDGSVLAYGVRRGGRDQLSIRFRNLKTNEDLDKDALPEARYLYWSLPMTPNASAVFYVKFEDDGPRVYRHDFAEAGKPDVVLFGTQFGPEKLLAANLSGDGRYLLATVLHGASGATDLYLKDLQSSAPFQTVVAGINATFNGHLLGDQLYIQTTWKAGRGQVFAASLSHPDIASWKTIIPEASDSTIQAIALTSNRIIVNSMRNAHSELLEYTLDGKTKQPIVLPGVGSVATLDTDATSTELTFSYTSFQTPNSFFTWHPAKQIAKISSPQVPPKLRNIVVEQLWYPSLDGTRVPILLAHRKGLKLDGNQPVLLYGYGGFNWAQLPTFSPEEAVWLEHGGIYAVANIRGGNELGEAWHRAGELEQKQHSFDDFVAAAKWLISEKYSRPERIAIQGLSNGGLLVTASITQHPELFAAAIGRYPLIDMIRYERFSIARWWTSEYGSVNDPEQFKILYAYSPYHHVIKGTHYPAVLFVTGDGDTRVDPSHARKMTAILQNATSSAKPVLILYDSKSGHSGTLAAAAEIDQTANELEFLMWQLNMPEVSR